MNNKFLLVVLLLSAPLGASQAPAQEVITAEHVEALAQQCNAAMVALQNQATEASIALVERLDWELLEKSRKCKEVDEQSRKNFEDGHKNLVKAIFCARSSLKKVQAVQRMGQLDFQVQDLQDHLSNNNTYRELADEAKRLSALFHSKQKCEHVVMFNNEGWTPSLRELANYNPDRLSKMLASRTAQFDKDSLQVRLAKQQGKFSGTNRCFVFRVPFNREQRKLIQKTTQLAPFTALYYFHSRDHAPLVVTSVLAEKNAFEEFTQQNARTTHRDVVVFEEAQGAAFIEYLNQVKLKSTALKITTITSNLGQFYKEHDEYQVALQAKTHEAINESLIKPLHLIIFEFLTNEHPDPQPQVNLAAKPSKGSKSLVAASTKK